MYNQLSIEMLNFQATSQLGFNADCTDQIKSIFTTQVQSINRVRAISVDLAIEPDFVFVTERNHD